MERVALAPGQPVEHLVFDGGSRLSELGHDGLASRGQSNAVPATVARVGLADEEPCSTEAVDHADGIASVNADHRSKPLLVCLFEMRKGDQDTEMVGRQVALGQHASPQAPRLGSQTGQQIARTEAQGVGDSRVAGPGSTATRPIFPGLVRRISIHNSHSI